MRVARPRLICVAWLLLTAMVAGAAPLAHAQGLRDVRVADDNGQFDFWLPPPQRPDVEFTNGARLHLSFDGAPVWGRWLTERPPSCAAPRADASCASTELEIGQEMYTPANAITQAEPQRGARPYAGFLYTSLTARLATARRSDAIAAEVGVTGAPSLAEKIQTAWHRLIGYPRPLGWSHQIPFMAGAMLSATHQQELVHLTVSGLPVLSVVPQATASLGNVLTGARAGAEGRLGYGVAPPWATTRETGGRLVEVYALAAVRGEYIAYQLVLDGHTTRPAQSVSRVPWVTQYEFGGGMRLGGVEVEYRGVTRSREYATGPAAHTYGTIALGVRSGW